jgi:hypothetical protein
MKKTGAILIVLALLGNLAYAQSNPEEKRFRAGLAVAAHRVLSYGTESDYRPGEDDFPVTPSHTVGGLGLSLGYVLTRFVSFELEGEYLFRSKMTLVDPSDGDSVEVRSAKRLTLALNAVFAPGQGRLRPFAAVGGGCDAILSKEETSISRLGYEITFSAPAKKIEPMLQAKIGVLYRLKPRWGGKLETGYRLIFGNPHKIHALRFQAGVIYGF